MQKNIKPQMKHVVSVSRFLWLNFHRYHAGIKRSKKNTATHSCEIPGIGGGGGLCSGYIYIYIYVLCIDIYVLVNIYVLCIDMIYIYIYR